MKNYVKVGNEIIRVEGIQLIQKYQAGGYEAQGIRIIYKDGSNLELHYHEKKKRQEVINAICDEIK